MHIYLCVRVPKSGSSSLGEIVASAFDGCSRFIMPNTLDLDGRISFVQRLRARRSRLRMLMTHYRALTLERAFEIIRETAESGDLIYGGHIDYASAQRHLGCPVKVITLLRDPAARSVSEYNYSRQGYFNKNLLARMDASVVAHAAAKYSFAGYLDFLLDHADIYGNIAANYVGWDGTRDIAAFADAHIYHWGALEKRERFAQGLGEKTGREIAFPHANKTQRLEITKVSTAERARIEKLYPLDFELHAHALAA